MVHANRAPILHQDYHYLQTNETELPLEPLHLGVPLAVSKMVLLDYGALGTTRASILHRDKHCLQTD
jgi:hypothetical protein